MNTRPAFIDFEDELRDNIENAEEKTGDNFSKMRAMIAAQGGVHAAKSLLAERERFTYRFKKLNDANLLDLTVEALVLKYADRNLFDPSEIDAAKWRLANAIKARD